MIRSKADILQSINQKHQVAATSNPFEITRDELQSVNTSDSADDSDSNDGNDGTIAATISTDANSTATHQTTNSLYANITTSQNNEAVNATTSPSNETTTQNLDQSSDTNHTMYNKTVVNDTAVIEIPNDTVEIVEIDGPDETVEIVEVEGTDDSTEIKYWTENVASVNASDVPSTFNITEENDSSEDSNSSDSEESNSSD